MKLPFVKFQVLFHIFFVLEYLSIVVARSDGVFCASMMMSLGAIRFPMFRKSRRAERRWFLCFVNGVAMSDSIFSLSESSSLIATPFTMLRGRPTFPLFHCPGWAPKSFSGGHREIVIDPATTITINFKAKIVGEIIIFVRAG